MNESPNELTAPRAGRRQWFAPLLASAVTATLFVVPMVLLGNPSGHDMQPHFAGWMDIRGQWSEGIWFPRWAEWSNFGFGEPRFIFYPPLSGLIGAALGVVLPWRAVPGVLVWFTLFGAGLCMYKLARDWLAPRHALIAAVWFAANPYHVVSIYYRSAFAELMAAALFPLMIWGVIRIARGEWKRAPVLAIVFAAIWLTNAPAAVIATYTIVVVLVVCCALRRTARPVIPAALAMIIAFGLAAFYVLPATWEQRWIDLALIASSDGSPERNFLFAVNNFRILLGFNWLVSAVAVSLMTFTGIAVLFSWRRRRMPPDLWWTMTALAIVSSLFMFPVSRFLWDYLPKLQFLQFPWRWLIVLTVAFAALVTSVTAANKKMLWFVSVCIFAAAITLSTRVYWGGKDASAVASRITSGLGYRSTTNFHPLGTNRVALDENAPRIQKLAPDGKLVDADMRLQIDRWSAEHKVFSAITDEEVTLGIKLLNYPAWQGFVDGQPGRLQSFEATGQILVTLPPGDHRVELVFQRTRDRKWGGVISVISLAMLVAAGAAIWWPRRGKKTQDG